MFLKDLAPEILGGASGGMSATAEMLSAVLPMLILGVVALGIGVAIVSVIRKAEL